MTATRKTFEAVDSSLGFYFQSAYALVLLSNAEDSNTVSVETTDDVILTGNGSPSLHQLKHSMGVPPKLNEKNDGLWKTIGNWLSLPDWKSYQFVFVTCADLTENCELAEMCKQHNRDVDAAGALLLAEANRVLAAPKRSPNSLKSKGAADYAVRRPACQCFIDLLDSDRAEFIARITLITSSFNAGDLSLALNRSLLTSYPTNLRQLLAERIIEWWDRRISRGLLNQAPRMVGKEELLEKLSQTHADLREPNLPDDFGQISPTTIEGELGGIMERQIEIVDGGHSRLLRAARDRWRARNQRERWLTERLSSASELQDLDERLVEAWADQHGPIVDDMQNSTEETKKSSGRTILDWSHNIAPNGVVSVRPNVDLPFVIRGSYQQLAEKLEVGWHPDFKLILDIDAGKAD